MGKVNQQDKKWAGSGQPLSAGDREREGQIRTTIGRRGFFKFLGLRALGLGFGVSIFDTIFQSGSASAAAEKAEEEMQHRLIMIGTVDFMGFKAKEITPNQEFYITTYSTVEPEIDSDKHRLRIEGLVGKPSVMTLKDLEALKDKEEFVTLQCIGNPVGGDAIGNALWEGVTLRKILDLARPGHGHRQGGLLLRGRVQRQHPLQPGALGRRIPGLAYERGASAQAARISLTIDRPRHLRHEKREMAFQDRAR